MCCFKGLGALRNGGFCLVMGWSKYQDMKGLNHGWLQRGAGCNDFRHRVEALGIFFECMGYECPTQKAVEPIVWPEPKNKQQKEQA